MTAEGDAIARSVVMIHLAIALGLGGFFFLVHVSTFYVYGLMCKFIYNLHHLLSLRLTIMP